MLSLWRLPAIEKVLYEATDEAYIYRIWHYTPDTEENRPTEYMKLDKKINID